MSLSDCPKCWDTPCTCGYEYRDYEKSRMVDFIFSVLTYHDKEYIDSVMVDVENKLSNIK